MTFSWFSFPLLWGSTASQFHILSIYTNFKVIWRWAIWWRKIGFWILRTLVLLLECSYYSHCVTLDWVTPCPPKSQWLNTRKRYSLLMLHVPNDSAGNPTPLRDSVTQPDWDSTVMELQLWGRMTWERKRLENSSWASPGLSLQGT